MSLIRLSHYKDLDYLVLLEEKCFEDHRRSSRASIRNSILSTSQDVYIIEAEGIRAGASIIHYYKKTLRIYSIAVDPNYQGRSVGKELMEHIINTGRSKGYSRVSLEADATNKKLIEWYKRFGFTVINKIEDYYGAGRPAYKMTLYLDELVETLPSRRKRNIVVTNIEVEWLRQLESIEVISAQNFIMDENYHHAAGVRIFNLCSSYSYQSIGYYVSLLASARDQRVIPNVMTIKDFSESMVAKSLGEEIFELLQKSLAQIEETEFSLNVYFGQTEDVKYLKLAKALYKLFEAPFLKFTFRKGNDWYLTNVSPIPIPAEEEVAGIVEYARKYFNQKRFRYSFFKDYQYDLAILVDPDEEHPPSCRIALEKFKAAGSRVGFYVDFITKEDYRRISEYDALFIRATTDVNDYTYQFARYAYAEGLIVIDDPWSILRCSNKMYLSERMKKGGVLTPKSWVLSKGSVDKDLIDSFEYPLILKKPDSAFSLGVHKAKDREEFDQIVDLLFKTSDLIIAQEYIESEYDWRIGVLDNAPLFASKYFMAKGHWQIYNWSSENQEDSYGDDEAVAINQVPSAILKVALKAASFMGDGFYGVDLKEANGKVYLIEVNDNPNVDYGIEDKILEDALYDKIVQSLYNRIENSRNVKRFISN